MDGVCAGAIFEYAGRYGTWLKVFTAGLYAPERVIERKAVLPMCGIVGMIGFGEKRIDRPLDIFRMMDLQRHRGPDDDGAVAFSWKADAFHKITREGTRGDRRDAAGYQGVLGFNRLSILDLSECGHQPMTNRGNDVAIVFNGEIYNAFELKDLYLKDCCFMSKTDTEIILELYLKFGIDKTVRLLNGMFALEQDRCSWPGTDTG